MKKFTKIPDIINYSAPETGNKKIQILVGMGTCGIAAGAQKVFEVLEQEISNKGLTDIEIKPVGCLGLCFSEPNIEIFVEGMPPVLYGKIDEDLARQLINQHVIRKVILDTNIYDKPFIDIYCDPEVSYE